MGSGRSTATGERETRREALRVVSKLAVPLHLVALWARVTKEATMLKCTMPKCRGSIGGVTGLDEIMKIRAHFRKAHKQDLDTSEALEVRIDMEEGRVPNLLRAMLGTERLDAQ